VVKVSLQIRDRAVNAMPNSSNESKQRWNASNYKQVKFCLKPDIAAAFKAACAEHEVSMASVLSTYMAAYSQTPCAGRNPPVTPYATRRMRRGAVKTIIKQMEQIVLAEEHYRDSIPENLQGGMRYEAADQSVDTMYEVIDLLNDVYQ
jgi:hypothetical protein